MTLKSFLALLVLLSCLVVAVPSCGQIEVSALPTAAESGAAGAPEPEAAATGGAAGAAGDGGAGGEGPSCLLPDDTSWLGCFGGQPCYVCSDAIAKYPIYLLRHPKCTSYYACDHNV